MNHEALCFVFFSLKKNKKGSQCIKVECFFIEGILFDIYFVTARIPENVFPSSGSVALKKKTHYFY